MPQMHVIDYQIHGGDMQFVEIELDPERRRWPRPGDDGMADGIEMETCSATLGARPGCPARWSVRGNGC
jgi:hypothetical protein